MTTSLALFASGKFAPDDVKILGDLDYGQSSGPVEYTGKSRYAAFVFAGKSGDRIARFTVELKKAGTASALDGN